MFPDSNIFLEDYANQVAFSYILSLYEGIKYCNPFSSYTLHSEKYPIGKCHSLSIQKSIIYFLLLKIYKK